MQSVRELASQKEPNTGRVDVNGDWAYIVHQLHDALVGQSIWGAFKTKTTDFVARSKVFVTLFLLWEYEK